MITRDAWVVKYVDGSFYGSNTFEKAKLFNRKGAATNAANHSRYFRPEWEARALKVTVTLDEDTNGTD